MKTTRTWTGVVCTALAFMLAGCATEIEMKPKSFKLGSQILTKDGVLDTPRSYFKSNDNQAIAWVEFEQAHGTHTVRFRWFNDRDELVKDSGIIQVSPDGQLYRWRRVWSILPIKDAPAQLMPGDWHVDIYFDDDKVETLKFEIKS
jgi:hypothetical protein